MTYDEQTYFRPEGNGGPACEVYGATGFYWYTTADEAAESFPKTETKPTKNPLFVVLVGMTARKLASRGFLRTLH